MIPECEFSFCHDSAVWEYTHTKTATLGYRCAEHRYLGPPDNGWIEKGLVPNPEGVEIDFG